MYNFCLVTEYYSVLFMDKKVLILQILYNWLILRVFKLAFFSKKNFPCIYFGVCSSQNNAINMNTY